LNHAAKFTQGQNFIFPKQVNSPSQGNIALSHLQNQGSLIKARMLFQGNNEE
jgi:hypothetical protein